LRGDVVLLDVEGDGAVFKVVLPLDSAG